MSKKKFMPAFVKTVDDKQLTEEQVRGLCKELKIPQDYIYLANIVDGFIDLKPEHPLYESIRKDIKDCLGRLKCAKLADKKP